MAGEEKWPDSTMDEQAKQQLHHIIGYKKKDGTYSVLSGFDWRIYDSWITLKDDKKTIKGNTI